MIQCPALARTVVIGNDAELVASVCAAVAEKGKFVPIIEGPRMGRPDHGIELTRALNCAVRLRPTYVLLVDQDQTVVAAAMNRWPNSTFTIMSFDDIPKLKIRMERKRDTVKCRPSDIALGLRTALSSQSNLEVAESGQPLQPNIAVTDHLVVFEKYDALAEVIASNYSAAIDADFLTIEEIDIELVESLLDRLYSIYESETSTADELKNLQTAISELIPDLIQPRYRFVTFVVRQIPLGFGYTLAPSTHLFAYPHLGRTIANNFAFEAAGSIDAALLIGAGGVDPQEFKTVIQSLTRRSVYVRGLDDPTIHTASRHIELFPYDLLMISTHCGDAPGYRWTYQFVDNEGLKREFVVDIAIEVMVVPGQEKLLVTQYKRFVSLDGVDWRDRKAKDAMHIGSAIADWIEQIANDELEPIKKESIDRVPGSSALQLSDGAYVAIPRALASNQSPIVVNNACVSWHRLAEAFTYADARAYIGTLFPISGFEAQEVVSRLFEKYATKPLALGLWRAQNDIYGKAESRRPYIMIGCHFTRMKFSRKHVPHRLVQKMRAELDRWERALEESHLPVDARRAYLDFSNFLRAEIKAMIDKWG